MKLTQSLAIDKATPIAFGKPLSRNEQKVIKGGLISYTLDCHEELGDCGSGLFAYVCCPDEMGMCEPAC